MTTLKGTLTSADMVDQEVEAIAPKVKGVQSVDVSTLAGASR